MRLFISVAIVFMVVAGPSAIAQAEELSVASLPPVVVKTVPQSGDTKVDPSIKQIKVTFSKEMTDKSWSWCGKIDSWTKGKPRYLSDHKTCVMPVRLKPGKTYAVWINSPSFRNFKDTTGKPAMPYLVVFETAKKSKSKSDK